MTIEEQIKNYPIHNSMRGYFGFYLFKEMAQNKDIFLLTGDLGYKLFDLHRVYFPDRFINCKAAEQAMLDMAVGLAYSNKIPVVYSITTFLIYRPFEVLRTYINHEKLSVKLAGSGRDNSYLHDGFSHDASDVKEFLEPMSNIVTLWPNNKEDIEESTKEFINNGRPTFISLLK